MLSSKRRVGQGVTLEMVLSSMNQWNHNAQFAHFGKAAVKLSDAAWIVALSIVRGLSTVQVREYVVRETFARRQQREDLRAPHVKIVEDLLQTIMLPDGQAPIPNFRFRYAPNGWGENVPWIQHITSG